MLRVAAGQGHMAAALQLRRCVTTPPKKADAASLKPSEGIPIVAPHSMALPVPRAEAAPAGPLHSQDPATKFHLPYRKVGNVLIIHVTDHPFKYSWELNAMLRQLRIEFRGQVVIHPDIPDVRLALWRVRHIVQVESINTDELKAMLGVPEHITFRDLAREMPNVAKTHLGSSGYLENFNAFRQLRQDRIKDIMKRDKLELTLLAERKKLKASKGASAN